MAYIETLIDVSTPAPAVWDAVRDFGSLHDRLVAGFVTDTQLDGAIRVVTFVNGAAAKEVLVSLDDDSWRLAYSVIESGLELTHHHAAVVVAPRPLGGARVTWTADVLPDSAAPTVRALMAQGSIAMKTTLEATAASAAVARLQEFAAKVGENCGETCWESRSGD